MEIFNVYLFESFEDGTTKITQIVLVTGNNLREAGCVRRETVLLKLVSVEILEEPG